MYERSHDSDTEDRCRALHDEYVLAIYTSSLRTPRKLHHLDCVARSKPCQRQQNSSRIHCGVVLTQRSKEPPILATRVPLFQRLLHGLLCILPLTYFLKCIIRHHALQTFQLQCVPCRHQVVIVDGLNKWLYFRSLVLAFLGHAARDLGGIAFYACNEGVGKWM